MDRLEEIGTGTIPCARCNIPTRMLGTRRCDRCYELERRIQAQPGLAQIILNEILARPEQILALVEIARRATLDWIEACDQMTAADLEAEDGDGKEEEREKIDQLVIKAHDRMVDIADLLPRNYHLNEEGNPLLVQLAKISHLSWAANISDRCGDALYNEIEFLEESLPGMAKEII